MYTFYVQSPRDIDNEQRGSCRKEIRTYAIFVPDQVNPQSVSGYSPVIFFGSSTGCKRPEAEFRDLQLTS